jgi:Zn-dependent protease with chaperone function
MTWLILALALQAAPASAPGPGHDPGELVPVAVPEPSPRAMDYYRSGIAVWFAAQAWGLLVPVAILFTGLSGRMRDLARRVVSLRSIPPVAPGEERPIHERRLAWFGTIAVYAILYLVLTYLMDLPIDYALGYVRQHEYGLSNQTLDRWLVEGLKRLGVKMVIAVLFLWVPYLVLARSPRRWWLWTGLLTLPFAVGGAIVKPIWIDPLFHDFGPMNDKALEAKILDLAARAGIDGGRVFEVDMSRDTKTVNAYVTGLFGTKRIVLWDTLLARLDEKETLAVMGHEMGHYVLNHVAWGVGLSTVGSLVLLFLVDRSGRALIRRFGPRFGFDRLSDVASIPLLVLLLHAFNLAGAPIALAVSRTMEHEADRFSLEITRANHSAATSFVKLQHENLSNPRPGWLSVLWRSSHPPIGDRIDFCNAYHPWTEGKSGRYVGDQHTPAP